jgi:hypothetical protein
MPELDYHTRYRQNLKSHCGNLVVHFTSRNLTPLQTDTTPAVKGKFQVFILHIGEQ